MSGDPDLGTETPTTFVGHMHVRGCVRECARGCGSAHVHEDARLFKWRTPFAFLEFRSDTYSFFGISYYHLFGFSELSK